MALMRLVIRRDKSMGNSKPLFPCRDLGGRVDDGTSASDDRLGVATIPYKLR